MLTIHILTDEFAAHRWIPRLDVERLDATDQASADVLDPSRGGSFWLIVDRAVSEFKLGDSSYLRNYD